MATRDCHAFESLGDQIARQRRHAWDIQKDIPWQLGVKPNHFLLPLDKDSLAFPGLSDEQRLALSQLAGLFVNSAIAEMESVIDRFRDSAWRQMFRAFPVNPEMEVLGELFFDEELKHSLLFRKFNHLFCHELGIDPEALASLLPQLFGTHFLDRIARNAKSGGNAFWWIVAGVEEVSIQIYQEMAPHRAAIDPLYFEIHRRHMEEETRHCNYAFLVLDLIEHSPKSLIGQIRTRADLILAQVYSTSWMLGELQKLWKLKKMGTLHPFFSTLASVLPHLRKVPALELAKRLFANTPYVSHFLNLRFHRGTYERALSTGMPFIPMPKPNSPRTFTGAQVL